MEMSNPNRSDSKFNIDQSLVSHLVTSQFPHWEHLPIKPMENSGWDNRTFHLGDQMTVRLPSRACYSSQVEKEHTWLPKLAPLLPLQIPIPLAKGNPEFGYPFNWSIFDILPFLRSRWSLKEGIP